MSESVTSIHRRLRSWESGDVGCRLLVLGIRPDTFVTAPNTSVTYDISDEFDAIIAMAGNPGQLGELRRLSSNPLAPLITGPHVTLPHSDFALSELSIAALTEAAVKIRPIVKAVDSLPQLPVESQREALVILGLAFTRGIDINARWTPEQRELVSYPLAWGLNNPEELLKEMAAAKLLRRAFFDCTHHCPKCASARLVAREVCTSCGASHLTESPLVHHYSCSYQGPQTSFQHTEAGLVCPKCDRPMRHYGIDYDKPATVTTCAACNLTMSDPAVSFVCVDCGADTRGETVSKREWFNYSLLPDGISALRAGKLPHRDFAPRAESQNLARPIRDFRLLIEQLLPIAKRFGRPFAAIQLRIDSLALTQSLGPNQTRKVCDLVQEIVVQGLRVSDFTAAVPDGVVACLPETTLDGAHVLVAAIRRRVADTVATAVQINVSAFDQDNIHVLLESLP